VQVVGEFPHRNTEPDTNFVKVFMHSKYSQLVLAYLASTKNSTFLAVHNFLVYT
jgi:hypothetical protein